MRINFILKGVGDPTNIYCRFTNGRQFDIVAATGIFVVKDLWNKKRQEVKNNYTVNKQLSLLKLHIFDNYNQDFMIGTHIDSVWLGKIIGTFFNRPLQSSGKDIKHRIFYTLFAEWWIKTKSAYWLTGSGKYMSEQERSKYIKFISIVRDFDKEINFRSLDNITITDFVNYLVGENYAQKTIKRHIGRFKFFCNRAEENEIKINSAYKTRVYIPKEKEIKEPYLNPEEIERIFKHKFTDNNLNNIRDNLIIAVWTGLRISDFNSLNTDNFIDDFIEVKTKKTGTWVTIPVHPMVKNILIKRNGKLPSKVSDQKFNIDVKTVCRLAGIKEVMEGRIYDKVKKRKVVGFYEKYKLVSSHIGRRSFATNLFGKISNSVIMSVCGWSSETMMLNYIKKTGQESAKQLQKYWEEVYN